MSMIEFIKTGKYSIEMRFDLNGAKQLAHAFELAIGGNNAVINARINVSLSKKLLVLNELHVTHNENENLLDILYSILILELDRDDLEIGIEKLKKCLEGGTFYPAEFTEILLKKSRQQMYLYGVFKN